MAVLSPGAMTPGVLYVKNCFFCKQFLNKHFTKYYFVCYNKQSNLH